MANTLITLLNEHGYTNTGDNRSYAIKSINNLLDSGFLQLKFVSYEKQKRVSVIFMKQKTVKNAVLFIKQPSLEKHIMVIGCLNLQTSTWVGDLALIREKTNINVWI